ncbi:MAG: hypothetical protein SVU32_03180, partial [Candidatus Nanohaloarchaea archaeon]|nr:hypothetical protein [Candidatus Nanohaloarchaea archaeon]
MVGTEIILLTAGLAVLWWAGDRSVRYAIELTELVGVSSFTVGFIVMSVSTGLPEIMTAIISSMSHAAELSAGDLVGSSLVNLTLILGILSIASPVTVTLVPLLGTIAYLILTIGFLWVVMLQNHGIEREHGYALVIIFHFYLIEEYGVAQVLYHIV